MPRLRIAATVTALVALAVAPAAAQATVTSSNITSWVSSQPETPANDPYLISVDNSPATTLTVSGDAAASSVADTVDIVCFYGSARSMATLATNVLVRNGTFTTTAVPLKNAVAARNLAGLACRLRAIPSGTTAESPAFTGPQIAVSEAETVAIAGGPNNGKAYSFYVNAATFTGSAAWSAPGTPSIDPNPINPNACGGPVLTPIDSTLGVDPDPALSCVGSLFSGDLGVFGGRSEVQIDGKNAYDAAAAEALFTRTSGDNGSGDLPGFPSFKTAFDWDSATGLMSSQSIESWATCVPPDLYPPTSIVACPGFSPTGVKLERDITTSDGGRVVTMTDTWSSTDGRAHAVDMLYDDFIGVQGQSNGDRGYEFPGQTGFSQYGQGTSVPGPSGALGSILVRTNVTAPDGDPSESAGAITFGATPSEFRFASNNELDEHNLVVVPAAGSASLTYIYSVGYSVADVNALALTAQDRFEPPSVVIAPPDATTISTPTTTLSGITSAGSGITSLEVGGQTVPVASNGAWTAQVPLSPGTNTITAVATDAAGATARAQVAVVYNPPPTPPAPVRCQVPRTKGMKLPAAEKTLRRSHCKVGKIKKQTSRAVRRGRVTSTSPRAGRTLRAGRKVELFVSKGR